MPSTANLLSYANREKVELPANGSEEFIAHLKSLEPRAGAANVDQDTLNLVKNAAQNALPKRWKKAVFEFVGSAVALAALGVYFYYKGGLN